MSAAAAFFFFFFRGWPVFFFPIDVARVSFGTVVAFAGGRGDLRRAEQVAMGEKKGAGTEEVEREGEHASRPSKTGNERVTSDRKGAT